MSLLKNIGLISVLIIVIAGCAPRPIYRLHSLSKQSTFYQGTEYIHSTADSITVTVAYMQHQDGHVIFDVEVANYSGHVVRVDPIHFTYEAFRSDEFIASGSAINPESKLLNIDMQISEEQADQKSMMLLSAIGAAAMITEEITDNEEDSYEDETEEAAATYALAASASAGIESSQYEARSLRHKRQRWAHETLRKTDLFSDDYIRGIVFFPIAENADVYQIRIQVGHTIHTFRFRQFKYKP